MSEHGPLHGTLIVDLSRVLAGPFCTMVLGELGARVIKVERPGGDDSRRFGPFIGGASAYFASVNRGKESIALDLKDPGGRAMLHRLLDRADVLVENFRPGAMDRLGLGWDDLHQRHPRLIYAALSGFGQTGPYSGRPAYDIVIQAMGGLMSLTGQPDGPPARAGSSLGDIIAGLYCVIGIEAALLRRGQDGAGALVDVAMLDCQVAILENAIARCQADGQVPGRLGARHPSITPFDAFACKEGFIVIGAGNDELFGRLVRALDRPDLARDGRFADNPSRTANQAALKAELESALAAAPAADWLARLGEAGVPCGPVNDVAAVLADPQVAARNMIVSTKLSGGGALRLAGNPVKLSGAPDPDSRRPAPELDQHGAAIRGEFKQDH